MLGVLLSYLSSVVIFLSYSFLSFVLTPALTCHRSLLIALRLARVSLRVRVLSHCRRSARGHVLLHLQEAHDQQPAAPLVLVSVTQTTGKHKGTDLGWTWEMT